MTKEPFDPPFVYTHSATRRKIHKAWDWAVLTVALLVIVPPVGLYGAWIWLSNKWRR